LKPWPPIIIGAPCIGMPCIGMPGIGAGRIGTIPGCIICTLHE
jgi:hypothetical protein